MGLAVSSFAGDGLFPESWCNFMLTSRHWISRRQASGEFFLFPCQIPIIQGAGPAAHVEGKVFVQTGFFPDVLE